jgi:hypothetical protein
VHLNPFSTISGTPLCWASTLHEEVTLFIAAEALGCAEAATRAQQRSADGLPESRLSSAHRLELPVRCVVQSSHQDQALVRELDLGVGYFIQLRIVIFFNLRSDT